MIWVSTLAESAVCFHLTCSAVLLKNNEWASYPSQSLICAVPSVGLTSPVSILKVVVFPAPFTPSRPKHFGKRRSVDSTRLAECSICNHFRNDLNKAVRVNHMIIVKSINWEFVMPVKRRPPSRFGWSSSKILTSCIHPDFIIITFEFTSKCFSTEGLGR